jgi:thiol:disulfide interchange protein DsbA
MTKMNARFLHAGRAWLASLLLATGAAQAAAPAVTLQDGVNYKRLEPAVPTNVAPGKAEVVEVFWYACGHCFLIEPKLDTWERAGKPASAQLVRMPATWNDILKTHARVFYTAELLGKLPAMHTEIFREVNVKGNRLDTPAAIQAYFVAHGVSQADFQKAWSSFAVESKVRRAEDLNRRYKITATPTIVVNGKYVTDVGMAGSEEKLFQVINALLDLDKPKG